MTDRYLAWLDMLARRDAALVALFWLASLIVAGFVAWDVAAATSNTRPDAWKSLFGTFFFALVFYGSLAFLAAGNPAHWFGR